MEYSPTVRGRRLMREIIRLRTERGLSMERAASQIGWSTSKIYRLENGRSRITTDDLADMLDAYGVMSPDRDSLLQLCRDARKRGWWTAYADVFTGSYMSMEAEASVIRVNANIVPGVLQTTHYARAVITATRPGMTTADAERRVAARAARQHALFSRDDPRASTSSSTRQCCSARSAADRSCAPSSPYWPKPRNAPESASRYCRSRPARTPGWTASSAS